MARKKKLVNRVISAVMALVMVLAYMPMPAPLSVSAAEGESTNEASVTYVDAEGQPGETTECATLAEAVKVANANEGSIITLLKDVSTAEEVEITGKDITLELDGKTLTGSNSWSVLKVASTGSLTIKSSVEGGTITTNNGCYVINNYGTLVIDSGAIENTAPENGTTRMGIRSDGTLTINDGDISGTSYGVHVTKGKATIIDGDISGGSCSINVSPNVQGNSAELVVEGGKLIGTSSGIIASANDMTVTVNGGYISGGDFALEAERGANIIINGGVLNGENVVDDEEDDTGAVTLGADIVLCDENYEVVELSSAKGTVYALKVSEVPEEAKKASVTVGGNVTKCFTLAEAVAVANANEGSTITLLKGVSTAEEVEITGKDITLDLNGKVLTGSNSQGVLYVTSTGSLTIKSSVEGGTITTNNGNDVIYNEGTLVIDSGAIENTIPENGVTREGIRSDGTLTINDGDISGTSVGVCVTKGKATIIDGDISGGKYSVEVNPNVPGNSAELIVEGGKLIGTSLGIVASANSGDVTVTVNDGYISGGDYALDDKRGANITINGGTLSGKKVVYEEGDTGAITLGEGVALYDENGEVVEISEATGTVYALKGDVEVTVYKDGNLTGYDSLDAAITAAGEEWSDITIIKDIKIDGDMTIHTQHNWYVSNNVTVTLADNATLTVEGALTNNGTISGGVVANKNTLYNNGTIGKIVNSGTLYSCDTESVITGELVINWENAEDEIIDLTGCYFPNGLKVSGTIGEKAVTITDVLPQGYITVDEEGNEIALTDGQTSVSGAVYIGKKSAVKVDSGSEVQSFDNLADAFYYAEDYSKVTITLLDDVIVDDCIYVDSSGDMIFDLNGKKVTFAPWEDADTDSVIDIYVYSDDKFTIKSSAPGGCIDGSKADYAIYVGGSGSAIIENGTFIGGYAGIVSSGNLTVNGGAIKGTYGAIENYEMLTINGGTFEATGDSTEDDVCVTLYNEGMATIIGGTFNNATTIWNDVEYSEMVSATVLGGTYPNGFGVVGGQTIADVLPSYSAFYKSADDAKISLTEGQTSIAEAVYAKATEVVSVTTKDGKEEKFFDLQSAFDYAYANTGLTVTLLDDVIVDDCIYVDSSGDMIFDLNGKKVTFAPWEDADTYSVIDIYIYSDDKFTIKSSAHGGCIDGSQAEYAIYVGGSGSAIIESGTLIGGYAGIDNSGNLTVNGGAIKGTDSAIENYGMLTVNGGTLSGDTVVYDDEDDTGAVTLGEGVALYDENGEVVDISEATGTVYALKGDVEVTVYKDGNLTGYDSLEAAIAAAGQEWSRITIVKNIKIDSDMTIHTQHDWYVSNNVTVTLADNATLTVEGTLTNSGIISGGVVANTNMLTNNGTIGKVINSGTLYSCDTESVITGELVINWENAEDEIIDLTGCYFPNGLTVSGTIGEKTVTITDVLPQGCTLVDEDGNEIALTEVQTSVSGAVYVGKKKMIKVTSGNTQMLFYNLADAFYYAEDYSKVTITLLDDVTVDDCIYAYSSAEMVFDLNGKKVTFAPWEDADTYSVIDIYVYSGDKFTIKSSAPGGCVDGSQADYAIYVSGSGSAIIENGTLIGGYAGIENWCVLAVNGGEIRGTYSAISNYGMLTVNGGTFEATGDSTEDEVCVTLYNEGMATIIGGTFNNATTIWNDVEYSEMVSATVLGGIYPNGFGVVGGQTIADVLPPNSALYKSADDAKVTVTEGQTNIAEAVYAKATEVVSVTTKDGKEEKFFDLQNAFDYAYANTGSTVTLLHDISTAATVIAGDMSGMAIPGMSDMVNITLDLNGKTWEYTGAEVALITVFVELTVKSSAPDGAIVASEAVAIGVEYGTVVIESGTYTGGYDGIYNMQGSVVIEGGVIKGGYDAIYNNSITTINGGTLEATDAEDGVTVYNEGQLVITGGTLNNASTIYNDITESEFASVAIAGGVYPNGLGVIGGNTLADVLVSNASIYDSEDEKITLTEDQISIQGPVYVEASKVASVTTKDGNVKDFVVLQNAFDYACDNAGSTIKLLDDITTSAIVIAGDMYSYTGMDIATFTLDLNGKTWNHTGSLGAVGIEFAALTIKSSVPGGKIVASNAMGAVLVEVGMLTIESGTIVGGQMGIVNASQLLINGGTVMGDAAVYNQGSAHVNGGTVTGTIAAIINEQEVAVTGGTLSYSDTEYGAVIINYGTVTIEGGTLDGAVTIANYQGLEEDSAPTVSIAGGEYPQGFAIDSQNAISAITVKEALTEGCAFVDADGNTVTLTDDQTSIAGAVSVDFPKNISVTTKDGVVTYYTYLSGALAEAAKNPGSTVTLLADITANMSVMAIGGEFTIDLNGKKYTLAEGDAYMAIGLLNSDVTIKSSVEGGTIDAPATNGNAITSMNGTLTIESGTIIGADAILNQGTLVIKDGTIKGVNYTVYNAGTATIDGGTFEYTDEENGAIFANVGKLVINGGTFKGNHTIDYGFGPVGPMMGEAVIAGGYFPNGINVNSYDGTDEESLLKNIIAEGCVLFKEDGTTVTLEDDQREIGEAVTVKAYGDADDDGVVDIKDAVMMKQHLAGMSDTGINLNLSDVNADGKVDIIDAVKLMQYLAGYEDIVLGSAS